jgi:hypothetical protein
MKHPLTHLRSIQTLQKSLRNNKKKFRIRMKKLIFSILIISLITLPVHAQRKQQETVLKREVTLYNPFKPSLSDVVKKSFLPDVTDTVLVRPEFRYDLHPQPFMPSYTINPLKPASLMPDPLTKLYKSYVKIGLGNYLSPLGEISITNERSKKGAIGINARHYSVNGKTKLQNNEKVFAGYMDNDASLFGKKFFDNSILNGSVDFSQKTRYAYGYDTIFKGYKPDTKKFRLNYYNTSVVLGLASDIVDSSRLNYDFNVDYNFFYSTSAFFQHSFGLHGLAAESYKGFYIGSGIDFDHYSFSDSTHTDPRFVASLSPFMERRTNDWYLKLGFRVLLDRQITGPAKPHFYPDVNFSFNIVPSYVNFFAELSGKMVQNEPLNVIGENPFFFPDRTLYNIPNTDYAFIVKGGLSGSTGIGGNYQLSASYSVVNDMLMYSNNVEYLSYFPLYSLQKGNFFKPLSDNAEILNIHGEMSGKITDYLSFNASANYNRYSLSKNDTAWNKPVWDATVGLKYNLMNKIVAGINFEAQGKRYALRSIETINLESSSFSNKGYPIPAHFIINLSAEYKYTKVLSFWLKFNNISIDRYYEWAFYPSLRFMGMVGFTYSL